MGKKEGKFFKRVKKRKKQNNHFKGATIILTDGFSIEVIKPEDNIMPSSILPTSNFQPVIISYKYEIKTKAFSQKCIFHQ